MYFSCSGFWLFERDLRYWYNIHFFINHDHMIMLDLAFVFGVIEMTSVLFFQDCSPEICFKVPWIYVVLD